MSGLFVGLLAGGIGGMVGVIGGGIGTAFRSRVLKDIGVAPLPKDPKIRYALMARRCPYIRTWTHYDSFNLAVFSFCMILLIAGCIVVGVGAAKQSVVAVGDTPVAFVILMTAIILLLITGFLMLFRFIELMNVLRFHDADVDIEAALAKQGGKKDFDPLPTRYYVFCGLAILAYMAGTPFFLKDLGVPYFIGWSVLFATFVSIYPLLLARKMKKRREDRKN